MLPAAHAATADKSAFARRLRIGEVTLNLQGTGIVYYRSIIKGLAVALYLDERATPKDVLADVPKRVEIEFFWALKGKTIAGAMAKSLSANLSDHELVPLQERIDTLHAAMADVRPGDRYALTYLPSDGTWLSHNGRAVATVSGREVAAAYFSIWFGDRPMDARLKRQLLGE